MKAKRKRKAIRGKPSEPPIPKVGDWVKFHTMPPGIETLPEESLRVFRFCLGRVYRVWDVDRNGLLALDVSKDIDHRFGGFMNDIHVEPECVTRTKARTSARR